MVGQATLVLMIGVALCASASDGLQVGHPPVRLGVDPQTVLPVFLGVSERNWMPALPAELECSEPCHLQGLDQSEGTIRGVWQTESHSRFWLEYVQTGSGVELALTSEAELRVTLRIPLDPLLTSITFLSSTRNSKGEPLLPGVLSAPDVGQLVIEPVGSDVGARTVGSRGRRRLNWILEFGLMPGVPAGARFAPAPPLRIDGVPADLRHSVSRYWWNIFTTRAEDDPHFEQDPIPVHRLQLLANNTLSDPVSFALFNIADMAMPIRGAPAVMLMRIVQESLTWWLENQVTDRGAVAGYAGYSTFLDANPSLLITAWDVVEKTGDTEWLGQRIRKLEMLADYLAARDLDGDGLVEAEVPGTPGFLIEPGRSSNWIDAINFGHKDAFANALIYRGWLCLAALEKRLGNHSLEAFYRHLAGQLRSSYRRVFYNPGTRMLAGWVDAAGRPAPYRFPGVNGLAVSVGLVDSADARRIMQQVADDLISAGFRRFDLGVPITLDPIEPFDYLAPAGFGYPDPSLPNGNWQNYENGGITPTQTAYYLGGLIRAGLSAEANRILQAMLRTQAAEGFQNGIVNEYPKGVDWRTWEGEPCGYEGYLNDNYYYLLTAALLDEQTWLRLFRPILQ